MRSRKIIYSTIGFLIVLAIILGLIVFHGKNSALKVIFLDIGQGDSILISQGSQQLLIDGGKDGKLLLEKLGKYIPFWDRDIEAIIETHPDQDHIGGLIDVVKTYKVHSVLETKMQSESQTFKKLEEEIEKRSVEKIEAKKGVTIKFVSGSIAEILYPLETIENTNSQDTNSSSVVVKLTMDKGNFLFTGDLPTTEENNLLSENIDVSTDFLKISHHGSKYATSSEFLEKTKPREAIISVGKNNSYGHPNSEVLQRLLQKGISVFRTDEIGDIVYECKSFKQKCERIVQ